MLENNSATAAHEQPFVVNTREEPVDRALDAIENPTVSKPPPPPTIEELQQLEAIAGAISLASYFDQAADPDVAKAQALAKILYGRELGLQPMQSMTSIHVIPSKGKIKLEIAAETMLELIRRVGGSHIDHITEDGVRIEWFRDGDPVGETKFTLSDARKAGLVGKENYTKYAEDMLYWRAVSRGKRRYFPDATNGIPIYVQGETQEGETRTEAPKAEESPYEEKRAAVLTPEDFEKEEKPIATRYIEHLLREKGQLSEKARATKAQVLAFFDSWHPKTKAELMEAAKEMFGETNATPETPEPEQPTQPEPQPEKRQPKRQSLFGNGKRADL